MKSGLFLLALAATISSTAPALAGGTGEKVNVTPQFSQPIPNIAGKSLKAVIVDYAPGAASPSHRHAQSAFIYAFVVSGEIRSQVDGGPVRIYRAGESWHETPGAHHTVSENASKTEPARLLAIFVVDSDEKVLTTPDPK